MNSPLRIKSLGIVDTDLLIGTYIADTVNKTRVYRWNTLSVSFTSSDPIEEVGINAFLPGDNYVLWGNSTMANEGGSWSCIWTGTRAANATHETDGVCTGIDGYKGLRSYLHQIGPSGDDLSLFGWIETAK